MRIPIERLKELSKQYDLSHLILYAYHPGSKEHHVVTYGVTLEGCSQAADFGNKLKDALGFPEELHAQPSRVKRLQKQIADLEAEIKHLRNTVDMAYDRMLFVDALEYDYKTEQEAWLDAIALLQEIRGEESTIT